MVSVIGFSLRRIPDFSCGICPIISRHEFMVPYAFVYANLFLSVSPSLPIENRTSRMAASESRI
ncbi:hypothetical protein B0E45_23875 [Sinorhizobium sp. A49]|nr:hypothetical protein B0E45_23875 [Sinorhizobium sp. A49]